MVTNDFLDQIRDDAEKADVFGPIECSDGCLSCQARDCEADAAYRVEEDEAGRIWVSFVTPDRWLSESIEADLEHTGDELEELIEEELSELGLDQSIAYEHFRSDDMLFTFRSAVPVDRSTEPADAARLASLYLRAYEACFRELGDVAPSDENVL